MSLKGKKILLGISGSIAAYKTPQLVRLMVKAGAEVQVIMTESAKDFVTPLSLSTVSKKTVFSQIQNGEQWNDHVRLGRWADLFILAPASANTLAKMAHGICDNILLAVYLSSNCPIFIAPAMDEDMWLHPATKNNVKTLQSFNYHFIDTEHGELASGIIGYGRMAEPEHIFEKISTYFENRRSLKVNVDKKKVLITAGPTYEPIDPVRFIGNFSTGKMGVAIAKAFAELGHEVILVLGPSNIQVEHDHIIVHRVQTAQEMYDTCVQHFESVDIAVMSAAVADYRPAHAATEKIKKENTKDLKIDLVKNPDILNTLGHVKKEHQFVVGFALETNNEKANALDKLYRKNADMIVLNSLQDENAGFGYDTNKVTFILKDSPAQELPLLPKDAVAEKIVQFILSSPKIKR